MGEAKNRYRATIQILWVMLWVTLLVVAVESWAGWATRSLSLLAEALHSLLDGYSILAGLQSLPLYRLVNRSLLTHRKRDTALLLMVVAILGFAGFSLAGAALFQVFAASQGATSPVMLNFSLVTLVAVVVAIHFCFVLFERHEARLLQSAVLRANAYHFLADSGLTALLMLGLVGVAAGYLWLDAVLAIAWVLLLMPSLWRLLRWQLPSLLMQVAIAPDAIAQLAFQVEGVASCQHIRTSGIVGEQVLVRMHLLIHPEFMSVAQLIANRLEALLRDRYGPLQAQFHIRDFTQADRD